MTTDHVAVGKNYPPCDIRRNAPQTADYANGQVTSAGQKFR
ncbi:hypothetical protein Z948_747 [Sulfitobacter donghicola DSW-25 = KCTC 12864 = JCM 14565]|nr:hypothetical protein Z948_747 [Sulfitobacter donghicola DSW-25 = KCTC 12864 = JCM 14565]